MTKLERYKRTRRLGMWRKLVDKRLRDLQDMSVGDLSKAEKFAPCNWCERVRDNGNGSVHCHRCPAYSIRDREDCRQGSLLAGSRFNLYRALRAYSFQRSTTTHRGVVRAATRHYKNLKRITGAWFANEQKELSYGICSH